MGVSQIFIISGHLKRSLAAHEKYLQVRRNSSLQTIFNPLIISISSKDIIEDFFPGFKSRVPQEDGQFRQRTLQSHLRSTDQESLSRRYVHTKPIPVQVHVVCYNPKVHLITIDKTEFVKH